MSKDLVDADIEFSKDGQSFQKSEQSFPGFIFAHEGLRNV